MSRITQVATALLTLATPALCGDVSLTLIGDVSTNVYSSGPFSNAVSGDTATLTFDITLPGVDVSPNVATNFPIDVSTFDLNINGSTGAALGGPTNLFIANDFPGADGFRIFQTQLASGHFFTCEIGLLGTVFPSGTTQLDQLTGIYDVGTMLTSFNYTIQGQGGFMEIFPTTLVISVDPVTFCNGDGGNQMGCTNCPCSNNAAIGTIGGCLNSAGTSAQLASSGSTSVSLPSGATSDLRFGLTGAPPLAFCILNSGDAVATTNMASPCFGLNSGVQSVSFDGLRCAVSNTRRHGGRSADANGEVGVTNSPWGGEGGPPVGIAVAGGGFAAGQTRYFQVINRDDPMAVCQRALNTSQAIEISFTP